MIYQQAFRREKKICENLFITFIFSQAQSCQNYYHNRTHIRCFFYVNMIGHYYRRQTIAKVHHFNAFITKTAKADNVAK